MLRKHNAHISSIWNKVKTNSLIRNKVSSPLKPVFLVGTLKQKMSIK